MWDGRHFETVHTEAVRVESPRSQACLEALRQALHLPAGAAEENNELHFALEPAIDVSVVGGADRIVTLAGIAPTSSLALESLVDALEHAGQWGLAGESLRLVVLDQTLALLWTTQVHDDAQTFVRLASDALARAVKLAHALSWGMAGEEAVAY